MINLCLFQNLAGAKAGFHADTYRFSDGVSKTLIPLKGPNPLDISRPPKTATSSNQDGWNRKALK